jgi:hypothetical protein
MGLLDKPGPHRLENGYLEPSNSDKDRPELLDRVSSRSGLTKPAPTLSGVTIKARAMLAQVRADGPG